MPSKGKHEAGTSGAFYRDLAIMILGILLVGATVFVILLLLADPPPVDTTIAAAPTTATSEATTSTSSPATTSTMATTTTTEASTTTTVPVRTPAEVRVLVLNSIGIDGAAGRMTERLQEAGYQTLTPDNYQPEQDPSRIWYREGFAAEATALLDFIEGALVEPLPDEGLAEGADIVMVLGTGYQE